MCQETFDQGREPATTCLVGIEDARRLRESWRAAGLRVVLTNGCFDLLHLGHSRYLSEARGLGDRLIVALNDDQSTRDLKGEGRPILPELDRAELLCALRSVDAVLLFSTTTAVDIVTLLEPEIYVKGGDYARAGSRPPEADAAERIGAQLRFLPFVEGRSTSEIIQRMRASGPRP